MLLEGAIDSGTSVQEGVKLSTSKKGKEQRRGADQSLNWFSKWFVYLREKHKQMQVMCWKAGTPRCSVAPLTKEILQILISEESPYFLPSHSHLPDTVTLSLSRPPSLSLAQHEFVAFCSFYTLSTAETGLALQKLVLFSAHIYTNGQTSPPLPSLSP